MALGVRTIAIRFLGDTKDLDSSAKSGQNAISGWRKGFAQLDKVATGVLIGVGGAIVGMTTKVAGAGDEIAKTSRKLGIGAEALQVYRFWAERNGIEASQLDRLVGNLNQRVGEAVDGNKRYGEAFKSLGVSLKDGQGNLRSTEDVLGDTVRALSEIEDPALQAGKASVIFGSRVGRELLPAIKDGSLSLDEAKKRAHELGLVMDDEALTSSEAFADALTDLKGAGAGLLQAFAVPFMQMFTDQILPVVMERVVPAFKSMGGFMGENKSLVLTLVGVLLGLAVAVKLVAAALAVYNTVTTLVSAATKIWAGIQLIFNAIMLANPITLIILAIIALIAIIVAIATRTQWFQNLWKVVWAFILTAAMNVWNWLKSLPTKIKVAFAVVKAFLLAPFKAAFKFVITQALNLWARLRAIPGKIKAGFARVKDFLLAPFRIAFNAIRSLWNSTIGGKGITIPSWVPGIGGRSFTIPRMHRGGVVPGRIGEETLILARAGETVRTREQEDEQGGGSFTGRLFLDSGEFLGVVRGIVTRNNADLKRRVLAGTGAAR